MRFLLKCSLPLTLLFASCIGLIRARPYDDSEVRAFLIPPDDCPMPCFIGIRPGVTTVDEALAILEVHEWVGEISNIFPDQTSANIYWRWIWKAARSFADSR